MARNGKRAARSKTLAISVSLVSGSGAGEQTNWTTCPRHSRAAQLCLQRSNLTDHQLPTHQTKIIRIFLFKSKRWPPCLHCAPSNYYIHWIKNCPLIPAAPPEVRMGKAGIDWKLVRTKLPLPILDSAKRMTTHKYTFSHKYRELYLVFPVCNSHFS